MEEEWWDGSNTQTSPPSQPLLVSHEKHDINISPDVKALNNAWHAHTVIMNAHCVSLLYPPPHLSTGQCDNTTASPSLSSCCMGASQPIIAVSLLLLHDPNHHRQHTHTHTHTHTHSSTMPQGHAAPFTLSFQTLFFLSLLSILSLHPWWKQIQQEGIMGIGEVRYHQYYANRLCGSATMPGQHWLTSWCIIRLRELQYHGWTSRSDFCASQFLAIRSRWLTLTLSPKTYRQKDTFLK